MEELQKMQIKISDITKIKYKNKVTIYYTVDKIFICEIGTEEYQGEYIFLTLAKNFGRC